MGWDCHDVKRGSKAAKGLAPAAAEDKRGFTNPNLTRQQNDLKRFKTIQDNLLAELAPKSGWLREETGGKDTDDAAATGWLQFAFNENWLGVQKFVKGQSQRRKKARADYIVGGSYLVAQKEALAQKLAAVKFWALNNEKLPALVVTVGFDETLAAAQDDRADLEEKEDKADAKEGPGEAGEQEKEKGSEVGQADAIRSKTKEAAPRGWSFKNSMVVTLKVMWATAATTLNDVICVPPVQVQFTRALYLLLACLVVLEKFLFGCALGDFVSKQVGAFHAMLFIVVSDSASANILAVKYLLTVLDAARQTAGGMLLLMWQEPCGIHQATKGSLANLKACKLIGPVYSLFRLTRLSRFRKSLASSLRKLSTDRSAKTFRYHKGLPPPGNIYSSALRGKLVQLLSGYHSFQARVRRLEKELARKDKAFGDPDSETDHDESSVADAYFADLTFHNGDIRQPVLEHYCNGCCSGKAEARRRSAILGVNSTFGTGIPGFQPSRWLKQAPGIQWAARFEIPHRRLSQAVMKSTIGDAAAKGKGKGKTAQEFSEAATLADMMKKRLESFRSRSGERGFAFDLLMNAHFLVLLDTLLYTLFKVSSLHGESESKEDDTIPAPPKKRLRKKSTVPVAPAAAEPDRPTLPLFKVMAAVDNFHARLCKLLHDRGNLDVNVGFFGVAVCFWEGTPAELASKVRRGVLLLAAHIFLRFDLRYEHGPHFLAQQLCCKALTEEQSSKIRDEFCATKPCCLDKAG
eukprot:TRINITY_DN23347_c0_g1_i5.p1 TRINITY_DN23347_c0_g1~~TRINITY_DN23347_c0_g1_i5.p1  ORF type:complete len:747 (+),score=124.31 TRINITY_DN23347_c0_g1_i5:202-2442(+)